MLDALDLFRVEAGLLAFILAFYALCARENRAPYLTHTVYTEIGLVLLAVLATLMASIVDRIDCLSAFFSHCRAGYPICCHYRYTQASLLYRQSRPSSSRRQMVVGGSRIEATLYPSTSSQASGCDRCEL